MEISASASWHCHRHRNRHSNITIVFCTAHIAFRVEGYRSIYFHKTRHFQRSRNLTCEYIRNFQCFNRKALHKVCFFDKIEDCVLQGWNFIKTLVQHRLSSQKKNFFSFIFLKTDSFWYIFQKESVLSSLYSKVAA